MICGKKTICIAMTNSWDEKKRKNIYKCQIITHSSSHTGMVLVLTDY